MTDNTHRYLHIHVPKSAGSMFNTILAKNFGDRLGHDRPLISYIKYSQHDMEQLLWLYPYECFTSHVFCLKSMPLDLYPQLLAFAFIREPIDKVISSYFYIRGRQETANEHPTRKMTLPDLIESMVTKKNFNPFLLDTSQTEWLVGDKVNSIDIARDYLHKGYVHIFPTERFDESMVVLEKMLPHVFTDCSYLKKVNVSGKTCDDQYLKECRESAEMLPWIEMDTQLHRLANDHLDYLIRTNFKSYSNFERSLKKFKVRCKNKISIGKGNNSKTSLIHQASIKLNNLMIRYGKHG